MLKNRSPTHEVVYVIEWLTPKRVEWKFTPTKHNNIRTLILGIWIRSRKFTSSNICVFVLLFSIFSYFVRQFTPLDEHDVDCNTAKSTCEALGQGVVDLDTEEKLTGLCQEVQEFTILFTKMEEKNWS